MYIIKLMMHISLCIIIYQCKEKICLGCINIKVKIDLSHVKRETVLCHWTRGCGLNEPQWSASWPHTSHRGSKEKYPQPSAQVNTPPSSQSVSLLLCPVHRVSWKWVSDVETWWGTWPTVWEPLLGTAGTFRKQKVELKVKGYYRENM